MKRFSFLAISAAALFPVAAMADTSANLLLHGECDHSNMQYRPGEEMAFTLKLQGDSPVEAGKYSLVWTRKGDDGKQEEGKFEVKPNEPMVVKTSLGCPGFVYIYAELKDSEMKTVKSTHKNSNGGKVCFHGGAGVEIEKLETVPEPKDFDEFWAKQKQLLAKVPIKAERKEIPCKNNQVRIYEVKIDCADPRPVTGYLTIPTAADSGKKFPARAEFHGYSDNRIHRAPGGGPNNVVVLNINAHGYELGRDDQFYKDFYTSIRKNGHSYVLNESPDTPADELYFNGMVLRVMRALQYLKSLPEWDGQHLIASGGSQGGLQTMWAAGCGEGVTEATPSVTWGCDLGGQKVPNRIHIGWGIKFTNPGLLYYDAVNFAKRIPSTCRVIITRAGMGDYTCPPSGVAMSYNAMKCPKRIHWVQGSTHGYVPPAPQQVFDISGNGF